jgi:hypothetical protein
MFFGYLIKTDLKNIEKQFKLEINMTQLIKDSVAKAMDYSQYNTLFGELVAAGKTTGEETQEKIDYTKLNYSRTKRLDKTATIDSDAATIFKNVENKQTWLVISEPWCGDAAQSLPFLNKIAELSENIDLKIVLRDDNLALMDQYLTNGGRSIPKLIILDEDLNEIQQWGPRSEAATKLVTDYLAEHGKVDDTLKENLQVWYNKDKGVSIVGDLVSAVEIAKVKS